MKCSYIAAAAVLAALSFSQGAHALVWNEIDAGSLPGSAEITKGSLAAPLTGITGFLDSTAFIEGGFIYQVDLFRIRITDASMFSATSLGTTETDTALFLFDATGHGVYTNEDGIDLRGALPTGGVTSPGFYYLGVSLGGYQALDAGGANVFLPAGSGIDAPGADPNSGAVASWYASLGSSSSETAYSYSIALTGASVAAVPEPSAALLLGLGLAGIAVVRRQRRTAA